ncbi:hypothetical protein PMAYCL1PPCAC_07704, partial [Pristionchus mayeri]
FAITSILHEVVKRRRNEWSWKRMKKHRSLFNSYMQAYREKRTSSTLSKENEKIIENAEEKLDLWNLNLARTRVEMEIEKKSGNTPREAEISISLSSTPVTQSSEEEEKNNEEAQKAKLADSCERLNNISNFPKEYVDKQVRLSVDLIQLSLNDSIDIRLSKVSLNSSMRSGAAAADASIAISDVSMRGFGTNFVEKNSKNQWFLAQYITNPLDGSFDQKAVLSIEPIVVTFNKETIYELTQFFSPPESLMFNQLLSLHLSNYDAIVSNTLTGLKHAAAKRLRLILDLVVHPFTVIICEGGKFDEKKLMMEVKSGMFKIGMDSELNPKLGEEEKTKLLAYHRFALSWTGVGCSIAKNCGSKDVQPLFLPISTDLQFHMCGVEDQNLPRFQ